MPRARLAPLLALTSLLAACGRPMTASTPPGPAAPPIARAEATADPTDEPARASDDRTIARTIEFAEDDRGEPTTPVRAAPRRPPIPRFQLFGTRPTDGP